MKNLKTILLTTLFLLAVPASAMTLWDYYGGKLPSIHDRQDTYHKYFDDAYEGTASQNIAFLQALLDNEPAKDDSLTIENKPVDNQSEASPLLVLGASLPQGVAVFQTSLLSAITSSASSMTVVANSVRGGSTLSGYNCFTVDEGSSIAEYICGTVSGTTVSSLTRGVDPLTGTTTNATLQFAHRRGAEVKVTDFPVIQIMKHQLSGEDTFDNVLKYNSTAPACSGNDDICKKSYIDGVAVAGASNANTTTKGIVEIGTAIENASTTSTGSTGATLVVASAQATSTPLRGCDGTATKGALCVVVAQNNGTINPNFLATSTGNNYNWGGIHTFASTTIGGVSSTTYSGSTVNIDWSAGQTTMIQLNQSTTITFSNVTTGTAIRAIVCQDGTGSRTVSSWPSSMRWQTGFAPTLTTTALKCDIMSFLTGTSTTSVFGATSANF